MSKKDFIALANVVRDMPLFNGMIDKVVVTNMLADFCQTRNSNFNRNRWLGYIAGENGPSGGKV